MDIRTKLYDLASQENCDGEPYDTMQDAADYIAQLEQERDELRAHCEDLEGELKYHKRPSDCGYPKICSVCKDNRDIDELLDKTPAQSLAEIKAQAIEDAANNCELITGRSALREYAQQLREQS
jgi:hypothetical protein